MEEAERKVINVNNVKLSLSVVRISGSDIVEEGIIQGTYEEKAYKFISLKLVGVPKDKSSYFFIERDTFLKGDYAYFSDMYWKLRRNKRLDIVFFSVRYNKFLYFKIVGKVPATTVDKEVIISRGYSHLFGLIKKKDIVDYKLVDVADLSVIELIMSTITQRFYEEKMLDNI